MISYNVEERKVEESIQQLYRDFALQYSEIQKSGLPESEKQTKINELTENTRETEQILRSTRSLSEISSEDRESLGIKEVEEEFAQKTYGEFKTKVADVVIEEISQIQKRYNEIINNNELDKILDEGREFTRKIAKKKIKTKLKI